MIRILAVSDLPHRGLETMIEKHPERLKEVSCIVSCGDLDREYLEFLVDGINKELFFISGNHPHCDAEEGDADAPPWPRLRGSSKEAHRHIGGRDDLHGRVEPFKGFLVAGFGGSMWYNGKDNQFTEEEMTAVVRRLERRIRWFRLQDRVLNRPERDVIVISHAPLLNVHDQPDRCHNGFQCFHRFIKAVHPALWIHGHIHLPDAREQQVSLVNGVTVVNAFGCRVIEIDRRQIRVLSHCEVDKQ